MANGFTTYCSGKLDIMSKTQVTVALLAIAVSAQAKPKVFIPNYDEIMSALSAARVSWGYSAPDPIEIRYDALNACKLGPYGNPVIAVTQSLQSESTIRFDGGESDSTAGKSWVIRINSNCDWRRLDIADTILHEYGRIILGVEYKSSDVNSIMYGVVLGDQSITADDRNALAVKLSRQE